MSSIQSLTIFLDIDGVLNTYHSRQWLEPELIHNLSRLGDRIVLSTSWKSEWFPAGSEQHSSLRMSEFERILDQYGLHIEDKIGEGPRAKMIRKYVRKHRIKRYVVLDDEWWEGYEKMREYVWRVDGNIGLDEETVRKILETLEPATL